MDIHIPYNFKYRDYQKLLREYIKSGWKRASCRWHRRAWKDQTCFNILVEEAIKNKWWYAYIFPTYAQGKKVIWDSVDKSWKKFRDFIPQELLQWENWTELKISLVNWSFIQILWSDNIDSLRWTAYRWVVFSEYAFHNPIVWEVIRPVLAENWWFAIFNSTPNWKNHFYELDENFKTNPDYFHQVLTIDDTWVISNELIQEERGSWMTEQMIQQEYYCSFEVWAIWSYYIDQINQAKEQWRIISLPVNNDVPIDLYFDLWVNDSFTISFKQNEWMFYNFINYYEDNWKTLDHYFYYIDDYLQRNWLKLWFIHLPHDSNQKWQSYLVSWKTIIEKFQEKYWYHKIKFIPNKLSVNDWITEARKIFPNCRFDKDKCKQFIFALENYKKDYDDIKKVFRNQPRHDWSSHWADNFRYFAISDNSLIIKPKPQAYIPNYPWI